MRGLCGVVLILALGGGLWFGFAAMGISESAVHEIEALIAFLIVTVAAGAGFVAAAVDEAAKRIAPAPPSAASSAPKTEAT